MAFIEKSRDGDAAGPDLRSRSAPPLPRWRRGADTIKLERFGMSGVSYQSASLGRCTMHQMYYGVAGKTSVGFCGTKGGGMGTSLIGQTWGIRSPSPIPPSK